MLSIGAVVLCAPAAAIAQANGNLVITTDPSGVDVYVDGEKVGTSPAKAALMPGDHVVEARGPQGTASQVVKVTQGQSTLVPLKLTAPAQAAPAAPPAPSAAPAPPTPPPTPPPESAAPTPPPSSPSTASAGSMSFVEGDILSPAHPRRRLDVGVAGGLGLRCSNVSASATSSLGGGFLTGPKITGSFGGCGLAVHLVPLDYAIGDVHVDLGLGGPTGFGFHPGFAIGSPWFQVGPSESPLVMSVRFNADFLLESDTGTVQLGNATPALSGDLIGGEAGVNVGGSIPITRLITGEAAITGGAIMAGVHKTSTDLDNQTWSGWFFTMVVGVRI